MAFILVLIRAIEDSEYRSDRILTHLLKESPWLLNREGRPIRRPLRCSWSRDEGGLGHGDNRFCMCFESTGFNGKLKV